ncbi:MAG: hypothetical protein HN403_04465 [Rhodospirillales bacterium]|jgi:flagellar hook-associated protein 3 FlgL|nr:hypothetical protein [Rhodospirillales bacterium]
MSRIADLAASNALIGYILNTQSRLHDLETQVSTEKKSQTYSGIANESQHLINIENTNDLLAQYVRNNEIMDLRLEVAEASITGLEKTVKDFQDVLLTFKQADDFSEQSVKDIQDWAFQTLKTVESYLNTEADGRFLLSGARVTTQPADLGLTTLAAFQTEYDGATVTFPTTRDAHLSDFSISQDGAATPLTDWLIFERDAGAGVSRITATTGQFANIDAGAKFTVSGTASNDGTYTVQSVGGGGTTMDLVTEMLTDEANEAAATLTKIDGTVLNSVELTDLSFVRATDTITAGTVGSLAGIGVGEAFTIGGTTSNNGTYTVVSNDGTNIVVKPKYLTDEGGVGTEVDGTLTATSYYKGDKTTISHRVDDDRSFSYDLTAIDPAFEKVIRAISILAQGDFGTEGGLDQNTTRVNDVMALLDIGLTATVSGTPPYGTELTSNVEQIQRDLAFDRVLINQMNDSHKQLIGFFEAEIADTENIDRLEAVSRLLDDSQALEASYQALARIRSLSLHNFLPI